MNRPSRLLALLAITGCHAPVSAPTPFPATSVPFQVSSLQSTYYVRGHFWGRVAQDGAGIQVQIDSLYVKFPSQPPGLPTISIHELRLRSGLAYATPDGRWNVRIYSPPIALRDAAPIGDSILGPVRFTIPFPATFEVATDYLAFQFEFTMPMGPPQGPSTTYACGTPGMLMRPEASPDIGASGREYVSRC